MDKDLQEFIRVALHVEHVDDLASIREILHGGSENYRERVKSGLREALDQRNLTAHEWAMMTDVDFDDDAQLYRYLPAVYGYLFEGRSDAPEAPR